MGRLRIITSLGRRGPGVVDETSTSYNLAIHGALLKFQRTKQQSRYSKFWHVVVKFRIYMGRFRWSILTKFTGQNAIVNQP